jgi:hypothetical protein
MVLIFFFISFSKLEYPVDPWNEWGDYKLCGIQYTNFPLGWFAVPLGAVRYGGPRFYH